MKYPFKKTRVPHNVDVGMTLGQVVLHSSRVVVQRFLHFPVDDNVHLYPPLGYVRQYDVESRVGEVLYGTLEVDLRRKKPVVDEHLCLRVFQSGVYIVEVVVDRGPVDVELDIVAFVDVAKGVIDVGLDDRTVRKGIGYRVEEVAEHQAVGETDLVVSDVELDLQNQVGLDDDLHVLGKVVVLPEEYLLVVVLGDVPDAIVGDNHPPFEPGSIKATRSRSLSPG